MKKLQDFYSKHFKKYPTIQVRKQKTVQTISQITKLLISNLQHKKIIQHMPRKQMIKKMHFTLI